MFTKERAEIKINFRPLVVVFLSLLFGIASARKLYGGDGIYIALTVIVIAALLFYCVIKKKYLPFVLAAIFIFGGHGLYFASSALFMGKEYYDADISARICEVKEYENSVSIQLENVVANGDRVNGARIYLSGADASEFGVGDTIVLHGDLQHTKLFTLGRFNSTDYRDRVAYTLSADTDSFSIVKGDPHLDESARAKIKEVLTANMSERSAGIAYAVLTGEKDLVDSEVNSIYKSAGIVHLLAVSGLHVSFLSALISWILKKLKVNRFVNFTLLCVILLAYCYLCGFTPSVVRAAIMGVCLNLSLVFGREYDGLNSLSFAGIVTLMFSPLSAYDVGFLMSYSCVAAIMLLARPLSRIFAKFLPRAVGNTFAVSLAAQLGVLPFLASFMLSFNFLSVFANLLIIPFFGVLFPLIVCLIVISLIIPPIAPILKLADWGFVAIEEVARFFASTKAVINLIPFDGIISMLIYVAIFVFSYFLLASDKIKYIVMVAITIFLCVYVTVRPEFYPNDAAVAIFENRTSTTMVITTDSGKTLVVGFDENNTKYYLSSVGKTQVDYIIDPVDYMSDYYGAKSLTSDEGFADEIKYTRSSGIYTFEFDGYKILFTNLSKSGYNYSRIEEKLATGGYDFVYAKNYDVKGDYFIVSEEGGDRALSDGSLQFNLATAQTWRID